MDKLNLDKGSLKKFGITMGVAFLIIAGLILLKQKGGAEIIFIFCGLFFICAFVNPVILKPLYIFWMRLAFVLSWFNTRLILVIIFYLVFTPVGLIKRLFGSDSLERKIDKASLTYWKKKETLSLETSRYERQF